MNSVEVSLVSRTAIDALLEESDSKIDETILLKIGVRWSPRLHARMLQNEHDLVKKSSINIMISNEFYIVLNDGCNLK